KRRDWLGGSEVCSAAFSPHGKGLASAHGKAAPLWDSAPGRERAPLWGHDGEVRAGAFSPAGRTLAPRSPDRAVTPRNAADRRPGRDARRAGGTWLGGLGGRVPPRRAGAGGGGRRLRGPRRPRRAVGPAPARREWDTRPPAPVPRAPVPHAGRGVQPRRQAA